MALKTFLLAKFKLTCFGNYIIFVWFKLFLQKKTWNCVLFNGLKKNIYNKFFKYHEVNLYVLIFNKLF